MQDILQKFNRDLTIKAFSKSTKQNYFHKLKQFLIYCQKEKKEINSETFKDYLYNIIEKDKISESTLKQNIAAVKFFLNTQSTLLMT